MKIIAFLIVGAGEADRYLEPTLRQLWTDEIAVCLNNADEKTVNMVKKYASFTVIDNREWGKEQWRIKQDFLLKVADLNPDWIWCLDSDEIFDKRFTRQKAELLAKSPSDVAYQFWCIQLWNNDRQWRPDLSFPNVRFYKFVPSFGLHFLSQALHCGLAPMYAYKYASDSGLIFKHYGLMDRENRLRKVARYDKYDPRAVYKGKDWYAGLRNEKARVLPFEENQEFYDMLKEKNIIEHHKNKLPKIMNQKKAKIFLFRNNHGKVVEAVGKKQFQQFSKIKGFSYLQDIKKLGVVEAPVVKNDSRKMDELDTGESSSGLDNEGDRGREEEGDYESDRPIPSEELEG